jgi:prephenate dehydrogenase
MTSNPAESVGAVAVLGTGLVGTSVALASARVGCAVRGWDPDPGALEVAAANAGLVTAASLAEAVDGADLVLVSSPIAAVPEVVAEALRAAPGAVVTDAASIKGWVIEEVARLCGPTERARFVPGHPMGGSERSGPEHAAASMVDDIVWVLTPDDATEPQATDVVESWVLRIGGRPVRLDPARHDRLVAFVSHLPQTASTGLMDLAAAEESDEPDILLLAAGGFRDLTRLAASNPRLWSEILLANRTAIAEALTLYEARLRDLRERIVAGDAEGVEEAFDRAKRARLRLAAKPRVKAGVAVLQVQVPDRPGALARLTSVLSEGEVNIEDLQIVHSPEGGRGTVHLTVAVSLVTDAEGVLAAGGFDPIRLA